MSDAELEYYSALEAYERMLTAGCYSDDDLAYARARLAAARSAL